MSTRRFPNVDRTLSQRLERAEAIANASFVEAKARAFPGCGAQWIEVAGAYAMFDQPDSPCTQTFGLGIFEPPSDDDLRRIEDFFAERKAPVFHEVSPLCDLGLLSTLNQRGYHPVELTSLLFAPIDEIPPDPTSNPHIEVRLVQADEMDRWAAISAQGWQLPEEFRQFFDEQSRIHRSRQDMLCWMATIDREPVGTASLCISNDVAIIAGDSTIPSARGRGVQRALIEARIATARELGCAWIMMGALPGSVSQRNGERSGLRIAYTRIKWGRS